MSTFTIKRGDTAPALRFALIPEIIDLTGASVVFNLRGVLDRAPADIVAALPPVVEYQWQPGDTQSAGLYPAEFEVTYSDGRIETFPSANNLVVQIVPDLG